jgi:hypothetical protein
VDLQSVGLLDESIIAFMDYWIKRLLCICATGVLLAMPLLISGCVSKAKADAQAREAFFAGQQRAAQQLQTLGPTVTVMGPVKNKLIPWSVGLTLAQAVVAAQYYGAKDPTEITIIRNGEQIQVDPHRLLGGEDFPLEPRDIVALSNSP